MKQLILTINIFLFIVIVTTLTSCEDFISTDTNRVMLSDDNVLNSPNDTVYSIIGILTKVQKLSDKYVLLGELRGDLMDVTVNSETELRDLSNFSIDSTSSSFSDVKDFYAVINNCNFLIQKADTTITSSGEKPFIKEMSIAKSIRAWTYLQLVLNFGKATYFEKPLLTVNDTKETFPVYDLKQIIDTLISGLTPLVNIKVPIYGSIDGVESKYLYINPNFLLGDLYLWKASLNGGNVADCEKAAINYSNLIEKEKYKIVSDDAVKWTNQSFTGFSNSWSNIIYSTVANTELITTIKMSTFGLNGTTGTLADLASNYKLTASKRIIELFAEQTYAFPNTTAVPNIPIYNSGDLRQNGTLSFTTRDMNNDGTLLSAGSNIILKLLNNNIVVYRVGLLYLRYAEAVNRAGKPGLAYAVLKYGLNPISLTDTKKVPASDLIPAKNYFAMFNDADYSANVGVHSRGCGRSDINGRYIIPLTVNTKADSIVFVENAICDELALETAFEGNRFHDLMRMSYFRNDPAFLADKIAQKHTDYSYYFNLLVDTNNWLIPLKKYYQ